MMDRRNFLRTMGLGAAALATPRWRAAQAAPGDRPNIVLIMSDDMGFSDIGCYGSEIKTPNLDRLAAGGLRFTQFYNTARCCPTRASLLTGLYPHQAGVGHMMGDRGTDGYRGNLSRTCVTIAEVLKTAGYGTYMAGKWHVTRHIAPDGPKHNWPCQRGFDRFYGTIHGAGSFYDPNSLTRDNTQIPPDTENYYYTNAISDNAAKFITEHKGDGPLFLYVAYTAAHWPMHALPHDIAKYKGRYDKGWDALRAERHKRVIDLGLVDAKWPLTPRDPRVPAWKDAKNKEWHKRRMEVYAAMVDCMDQGIGRIVDALKKTGKFDDTLIFFLEDNGGCAEEFGSRGPIRPDPSKKIPLRPMAPGALQRAMKPAVTRDGRPVRTGVGVMPGPADTYIAYGRPWANASNTPFRLYKHWVHEGGIATPLIVHWPKGVKARNELRTEPSHLIDIMATCVDAAGATYPTERNVNANLPEVGNVNANLPEVGNLNANLPEVGNLREGTVHKIQPMEGKSLLPVLDGKPLEPRVLYWEHEGNRAIRQGKWKLVARGRNGKWELYDMAADRTEMNDLAAKFPERAGQMADAWEAYAIRTNVKPYPGGRRRKPKPKKEPKR